MPAAVQNSSEVVAREKVPRFEVFKERERELERVTDREAG